METAPGASVFKRRPVVFQTFTFDFAKFFIGDAKTAGDFTSGFCYWHLLVLGIAPK